MNALNMNEISILKNTHKGKLFPFFWLHQKAIVSVKCAKYIRNCQCKLFVRERLIEVTLSRYNTIKKNIVKKVLSEK